MNSDKIRRCLRKAALRPPEMPFLGVRGKPLSEGPNGVRKGPNLAKAKILAKYNTVNQSDRLPGGTKPTHAVWELEERERFVVT